MLLEGSIDNVKIFDCALTSSQIDSFCQVDITTALPEVVDLPYVVVFPNPTAGW